MTRYFMFVLLGWIAAQAPASDPSDTISDPIATPEGPDLVVVVGASGADEFLVPFRDASERWQEVGGKAGATIHVIGQPASSEAAEEAAAESDYERLRAVLDRLDVASEQPLWIVLIGHGTFAAEIAKFNLAGPDVSAHELSEWLEDFQRPIILINGASASGPFINRLSAPQRVLVTATQSGAEQNYARFGSYFAKAIGDLDADIDHDDAISVLEAYLHAAAATQQFYETEGRLATEHALLDDNGDGLGTPADFFRGVRAVKSPGSDAEVDGEMARRYSLLVSEDVAALTAQQRERRDQLEQQMGLLRGQKEKLSEDAYFEAFHELALQLAELYRDAEASQPGQDAEPEDVEPADTEPKDEEPADAEARGETSGNEAQEEN